MAGHRHWIRNADVVVTMDAARRELAGANIVAVEGPIASVGAGGPEDRAGWEVIDTAGCVVTAFGNAHQHLFQTLTRAVPACQDPLLFGWLEAGKRADLATPGRFRPQRCGRLGPGSGSRTLRPVYRSGLAGGRLPGGSRPHADHGGPGCGRRSCRALPHAPCTLGCCVGERSSRRRSRPPAVPVADGMKARLGCSRIGRERSPRGSSCRIKVDNPRLSGAHHV